MRVFHTKFYFFQELIKYSYAVKLNDNNFTFQNKIMILMHKFQILL
jgi:hypothetical protein